MIKDKIEPYNIKTMLSSIKYSTCLKKICKHFFFKKKRELNRWKRQPGMNVWDISPTETAENSCDIFLITLLPSISKYVPWKCTNKPHIIQGREKGGGSVLNMRPSRFCPFGCHLEGPCWRYLENMLMLNSERLSLFSF